MSEEEIWSLDPTGTFQSSPPNYSGFRVDGTVPR